MTFWNQNHWPLEHWHIEISSRCPLQCPRCTRQEVPEGLINTDLSLQWFKDNFAPILPHVKKITFCGDDGDPIYAKEFLEICEWIKQIKPGCQIVTITNGSGKKTEWWQKFAEIFNEQDHIHFSIDGDQQTNHNYRVNADWQSIMNGVDTLNEKNCKIFRTWAAIAFKFNIDKLDIMNEIAIEKKFDYFQLTKSSKFGSNYEAYPKDDPLEPDSQYVSQGRFTREIQNLSGREWHDSVLEIHEQRFKKQDHIGDIQPLCFVGNKGLYINSRGEFFPCCWTGLRYNHNKGIFDYVDRKRPLVDVLNDTGWNRMRVDFVNQTCPQECKEKCSYKKWSYEHATSW